MDELTQVLSSALNGDVKNSEDEDLLDFIQKNEKKKKEHLATA
jgi:NitT/TauT family transport system ATP-binding protein